MNGKVLCDRYRFNRPAVIPLLWHESECLVNTNNTIRQLWITGKPIASIPREDYIESPIDDERASEPELNYKEYNRENKLYKKAAEDMYRIAIKRSKDPKPELNDIQLRGLITDEVKKPNFFDDYRFLERDTGYDSAHISLHTRVQSKHY
jgi:hypothetical protein